MRVLVGFFLPQLGTLARFIRYSGVVLGDAFKFVDMHKWLLSFYDCKHSTYQLEFDGIEGTSIGLTLCNFTLIKCFNLRIIHSSATCPLGDEGFETVVTGLRDVIATSNGDP